MHEDPLLPRHFCRDASAGPALAAAPVPFLHPVWWVALALLLLNDHLLKGSGLLPGWLTGKLSDLAGLLMAPPLLVVLVGARRRAARLACFAAVALVFSAIKVHPPAARALESAMTALGVPWRIWCDPTDLAALLMLPFAWLLLEPRPAERKRLLRAALRISGITFGLLACMATSHRDGEAVWTTSAFLVNRTAGPLAVRLRWARASLDCARLPAQLGVALSPDLFGDGLTFQIEAGHSVPLREGGAHEAATFDPDLSAGDGAGGADSGVCEAVLVQAPGLVDRVVLTSPDPRGNVPPELQDPMSVPVPGLAITGQPGNLVATAYQGLPQADLEHNPARPACDVPQGSAFAWSELGESGASLQETLEAVETRPGGCLALRLSGGRTVDLCIGAADFPFVAGQGLRLTETGPDPTRGWRHLRVEGLSPGSARLEVHAGVIVDPEWAPPADAALAGHRIALVEDGCAAARVPCDAFVQGAQLRLDDRATLAPGERLQLLDGRVLVVGRVGRVLVGPTTCELARQSPLGRADLLIITPATPEEEP